MIGHLLNRTLGVWRPTTVDDGQGGQQVTYVSQGDVDAKVDQPSTEERLVAAQWGAEHTHNVYLAYGADVARNDELRGDGQRLRVLSTVAPSRTIYTKVRASLTEEGG